MSHALSERMQRIEERIVAACSRSGRSRPSVTLVNVSKRHPAEAIAAAYALGARHFGENYVQELCDKATQLEAHPAIRWHFIGHLQRNKVKLLVGRNCLIHGVDSLRLLEALQRRAKAHEVTADVLLQVRLGGEASKSGCAAEQLPELVDAAAGASHVHLHGLMAIPPAAEDPERTRPHFAALRAWQQKLGADRLPELSMGMSADFEVAIEEGATLVRIGTAIFGPRDATA